MRILVDASLLIYLNARMPDDEARRVEDFWLNLLRDHVLYTNIIVLDETIYVSKKKYGIGYGETIEFLDRAVLPHVDILSLGIEEYLEARKIMARYGLKPSDALHVATMIRHGLQAIASEDGDFDKAYVKRIWLE